MVNVTKSRYVSFSADKRIFRGKPYTDLVSSKTWKRFLTEGLDSFEYKVGLVPNDMENRPDLIANAAYGNYKLWWLICTANGIIDPTTELTAGKQLLIPII